MKRALVLATLYASACTPSSRERPDAARAADDATFSDASTCGSPIAGDYSVRMIGLAHGATSGGFPMAIAADGTFDGNLPRTFRHCTGTLTSDERAAITAALDGAGAFCRGNVTRCGPGADETYVDVAVEETGGRAHRFCYVNCEPRDESINSLLGALMAPLQRVFGAGGCEEVMYTPPYTTDYCPVATRDFDAGIR